MSRRVGVFGGTFDPIHIAHLVAALEVRHALGLDEVLLVVANEPWQKSGRALTPAEDRLAMVEAAVADVDGLQASRIEIDRGGVSYTVDTLHELAGDDLFLIVGSDVDLDTWKQADDVRRLAQVVVVTRPGSPPPADGVVVEIPALNVSASDLRRRLAEGRPVEFMVPKPVLRIIRDRGLYAGGG
ncbi:MAG TPA: nicotinate-nucleotide adenylyltransferase [Acidimicrobiales bacterium]|nr:nicotinate-nucleotide adenylyltransferase [Acidimicrobiales bacterium]